jgi:hypothetical protein
MTMKTLRRFFRPLLALSLLAASVPSWACARSCDGKAVTLACVQVCEQSQALLSQHGKLATLGQDRCEVRVSAAPDATLSAAPELGAPALAYSLPAPVIAPALSIQPRVVSATRGPPAFASVLLIETPRNTAPPFFG